MTTENITLLGILIILQIIMLVVHEEIE